SADRPPLSRGSGCHRHRRDRRHVAWGCGDEDSSLESGTRKLVPEGREAMTAGPPDEFLKSLWKSQPQEIKQLSVEEIRARAEAFQLKTRRNILAAGSFCIVLAASVGCLVWKEPDPIIRIGEIFYVIGILFWLWIARDLWPGDLPSPSATA